MAAALLAGDGPGEVYGDSAYGTGDLRAALQDAGHTAVIKPKPLKPAVEGGFTLDDFTADETAGTVTCPAGVTRRISARRNVTFGAACRGCPLRARCTASKTGRALTLHPRDALLRAARHDWATQPALREDYKKYRPNVERVISQVASRGGRRLKLRYLGTTRNNAWLKNRTAALNLRNLISPRPGPPERDMGTGLTSRPPRPPGPLATAPFRPARLAIGGKSDHVADPQGPGPLPYRRPCWRSSRPRSPFIQDPPRRNRRLAGGLPAP